MLRGIASLILSVAVFVANSSLAGAATYTFANFTGSINPGSANVKAPFTSEFTQGQIFTGNFVFANELIPTGTIPTNVFFANFPDIGQIPSATAFTLNFGSYTFQLSDNIIANPGIQYVNNGQFNGFVFVTNFSFLGSDYQFRINGRDITVRLVDPLSGFATGSSLINARILVGNDNLTGAVPYTPGTEVAPVPGPAVGAGLPGLVLAFSGLVMWWRCRQALQA